jgi:hypothetical protein
LEPGERNVYATVSFKDDVLRVTIWTLIATDRDGSKRLQLDSVAVERPELLTKVAGPA